MKPFIRIGALVLAALLLLTLVASAVTTAFAVSAGDAADREPGDIMIPIVPGDLIRESFTVAADKTTVSPGDAVTVTVTVPAMTTRNVAIKLMYDVDFFTCEGGEVKLSGGIQSAVDYETAGKVDCTWTARNAAAISGEAFSVTFRVKDSAAECGVITYQQALADGYAVTANDVVFEVLCQHSYGAWTADGDSGHKRTCSKCGEIETGDHRWDAGKVTKEPTCVKAGDKTYTCSDCGATKKEVLDLIAHNYGDWVQLSDKSHQKICAGCGDIQIAAHEWDAGKVTKEPTCADTGVKTYTCGICGGTKTEPIAATGKHTYKDGADRACDVCGQIRIFYTLSASAQSVRCGGTVTLSVNASEAADCTGLSLCVSYDPEIFAFVSGSCNLSGGQTAGVEETEPGKLNCSWADRNGRNVSGAVFTIELKVRENAAEGQTALTAAETQAAVNGKPVDTVAGTLKLTVTNYLLGDVNADGKKDTNDAVYLLLGAMFGTEDYPVPDGMPLDFNTDGKVDTNDAVYLLLHVMFGAEDYPL